MSKEMVNQDNFIQFQHKHAGAQAWFGLCKLIRKHRSVRFIFLNRNGNINMLKPPPNFPSKGAVPKPAELLPLLLGVSCPQCKMAFLQQSTPHIVPAYGDAIMWKHYEQHDQHLNILHTANRYAYKSIQRGKQILLKLSKDAASPVYLISMSERCFSKARCIFCSACFSLHRDAISSRNGSHCSPRPFNKTSRKQAKTVRFGSVCTAALHISSYFLQPLQTISNSFKKSKSSSQSQETPTDASFPKLVKQLGGAA